MDQQVFWNDIYMDSVETQNLPDFSLSPSDTNLPYVNQASEENAALSIWNSGAPSSSRHPINQDNHVETKTEHGWASSLTINGDWESRTEERQSAATNMVPMEHININLNSSQVENDQLLSQNSTANGFLQHTDLNTEHIGTNSQLPEAGQFLNPHNPGSSGSVHVSASGGSSNLCGSSSRGVGFLTENAEGAPGSSFDGRLLSCKRKNIEGFPSQCSASGSSSHFQQSEIPPLLHTIATRRLANTTLSISSSSNFLSGINPPEDQLNTRIGNTSRVGASGTHPSLSVAANAESFQRNCRMRVNPTQNEVPLASQWPPGCTHRIPDPWTLHQPSSLLVPFSQPGESRPMVLGGTSESQPHMLAVPGLVQNMHSFPLNGAPSSRTGSSSRSPVIAGEMLLPSRVETSSRSMTRSNVPEPPVFTSTTDVRHVVQDPTSWSLANGSLSIPGHIASASRAGATSRAYQPSAPTWVPHQNSPPQYQRGSVEVARRSLFPSGGSGSGQSINVIPQRAVHSNASQEISHQSAAVVRSHQQQQMRSALLMDRQGDGAPGIPLSMRPLVTGRDGRNRMLLEIRNALQSVRRGENIRFEDVFLFDHSVFYGRAADVHDRHRDMRLDVDNMSYEELLALEERIGNVSTGLTEEKVLKRLKQRKYISLSDEIPKEVEPCCICQEEYVEGDDVGRLDCGHDFHTACVKQWLTLKNLCPICKTTGLVI